MMMQFFHGPDKLSECGIIIAPTHTSNASEKGLQSVLL